MNVRKLVYVAGPFRGADHWQIAQNIRKAEALAWEVWSAGYVAICPHLNTIHFQDSLPDDVWLEGDLELVRRSDAVLMVPGWERSEGARAEKVFAEDNHIPWFTSLGELVTADKQGFVPVRGK
jgi:hypothetical protein